MIHIHGYAQQSVDDRGLLEMKEITISASSSILREIADFLSHTAELMDDAGFARTSHIHIGSIIPNWDKRFPNRDIIVMPPMPACKGEE